MFRIILALDILDGKVVHAVRGERHKYAPIDRISHICHSSDPVEVVNRLRPMEVYVADLNRLMNKGDNFDVAVRIAPLSCAMLDLGCKNRDDISLGLQIAEKVVLGTETASLDMLKAAPERTCVSIDIKHGRVLSSDPALRISPAALIRELNDLHFDEVIILDLDRVGTGLGPDTALLGDIIEHSDHPVLLGGGVGALRDLEILKELGAKGAIVATAIHNNSIPLDMIRGKEA
ncbi:MAG: phosphoribosylformimino-5-aminoimidazole carboxamide ribotide isomerase [Methanocellales archaeon]|nr:phosphoribosylformimino-5-aminoimidazole carboxamide ribotide isomerase [Methanocellales archaeon]